MKLKSYVLVKQMLRANRYFLPGYVWHITHRSHQRQFLLRFARDRRASNRADKILWRLYEPNLGLAGDEIIPLTEIFEDLKIHRLVLGEEFYGLLLKQAELTLDAAHAPSLDDWANGKAWARVQEEIRSATEAAFGIERIRW